jgi:hypothetical protein
VAIGNGRAFQQPVSPFADYARTGETRCIGPSQYLIVEGLFVPYRPERLAMRDTRVYV